MAPDRVFLAWAPSEKWRFFADVLKSRQDFADVPNFSNKCHFAKWAC